MDSKVRGIKFVASQVRYKEIKEVEGSEAMVKDKGFSFQITNIDQFQQRLEAVQCGRNHMELEVSRSEFKTWLYDQRAY